LAAGMVGAVVVGAAVVGSTAAAVVGGVTRTK
jgi:hypothetical protein